MYVCPPGCGCCSLVETTVHEMIAEYEHGRAYRLLHTLSMDGHYLIDMKIEIIEIPGVPLSGS
jgi:hypothetical protein